MNGSKKRKGPALYPSEVPSHIALGHSQIYGSYFDLKTKRWGYKCCKSLDRSSLCPNSVNVDEKADFMEPLKTTQVTKRKKVGPSLPATGLPVTLSLLDHLHGHQDHFEKIKPRSEFGTAEEVVYVSIVYVETSVVDLVPHGKQEGGKHEMFVVISSVYHRSSEAAEAEEVSSGVEKLVKLVQKHQLNPKILKGLETILDHVVNKRFIDANRLYFDLSIVPLVFPLIVLYTRRRKGKEPWPIGVGECNTYEQGKMRGAKFRHNIILHDEEYRHLVLQVVQNHVDW